MEVQNKFTGFHLLSGFAAYVFREKFHEFADRIMFYSGKAESPLVQQMIQLPDVEQRVHSSARELLHWLQGDKVMEYPLYLIKKWKNNCLGGINQFDIEIRDIVEINSIRQSALLDFVLTYCGAKDQVHWLHHEIRTFFDDFNKHAFEAYTLLLKEKLRTSEERLLEAQTIAEVGSFTLNLRNYSKECTPQLKRILENDRLLGLSDFLQNVNEDDKKKLKLEYRKALSTGVFNCEYRYMISGREKNLYTRAVIEFNGKVPVVMKGIVQDISSWKKVESELVHRSVALREANASLEHFAAMASHDLKEPLRKIQTYASIIDLKEKERLSVAGQNHFRKITKAADRMAHLIDNLLTYSSIDKNEQVTDCSLQDILDEVLELLELEIKKKDALILSDGLPNARVVPYQIQQLFQNLISNSLKFCKQDEKPIVLISHSLFDPGLQSREKKILTIEMADNCIGISDEHKEKIFEVFYRVRDTSVVEGNGLGLAICRKIVENHRGYISFKSEENMGTTFKIVLPQ